MKPIPHHELSGIFRMMNSEERAMLKEGMKRHGYDKNKPVVLFEGKILDGRNRQDVALELGKKFPTIEFIPNGITPIDFVVQENLNRRHLSVGQVAVAALDVYDKLKPMFMVRRKEDGVETEFKGACNRNRAVHVSKMFGIGRSGVTSALTMRKYAPELLEKVRSGELTLSKALAFMPKIRRGTKRPTYARLEIINDSLAHDALKQFETPFEIPKVFDSYEKFHGEAFKKLNDAGYIAQAVFCARKVFFQVIKKSENFRPWGDRRSEYDFKLAAVAAMTDVMKKHLK